jgi:Tfp pilus assembly protein PilO
MKPLKQWIFADVTAFVKSVDKKTWLTALSCAVGFLVVVVFLVIPAWIERPLLRREIRDMETKIRQVEALNLKRPGWEENKKVFGAIIENTQTRVFTAEDMGLLLGQVSRMAEETGVEVLSSKPLAEKAVFPPPYHLKYQPNGYEFSVQGGYHDLGNLISRIENHKKLLRIQTLEITSSDKTPDRHVVDLKLWAILKAPPQAAVPAKAKKAAKAKSAKK